AIEDLSATAEDLDRVREAVIDRLADAAGGTVAAAPPPEVLIRMPQVRAHPFAQPDAPAADVVAELRDLIHRHTLAEARHLTRAECAAEAAAQGLPDPEAIDLTDAAPLSPEAAAALHEAVAGPQARLAAPILESLRAQTPEDAEGQSEEAVRAWQRLLDDIGFDPKKP
ncbi:MAG: hypothetical protein AAFQ88_14270, partial [Pseudomonadota bacterium]